MRVDVGGDVVGGLGGEEGKKGWDWGAGGYWGWGESVVGLGGGEVCGGGLAGFAFCGRGARRLWWLGLRDVVLFTGWWVRGAGLVGGGLELRVCGVGDC